MISSSQRPLPDNTQRSQQTKSMPPARFFYSVFIDQNVHTAFELVVLRPVIFLCKLVTPVLFMYCVMLVLSSVLGKLWSCAEEKCDVVSGVLWIELHSITSRYLPKPSVRAACDSSSIWRALGNQCSQ
jgi:hypothetical protein